MSHASKSILIIGGGVIGLCTAYYAALRGHRVTILERGEEYHDGCSRGNAGMVVPSHVVPLAAPGMIGMGLKMMLNSESPFYIRPRLSLELLGWAWKFYRACTPAHVARAAPLLRDLNLVSRNCFEELSGDGEFGLVKKGLLMLCRGEEALHEEVKTVELARSLGMPAEVLTPQQTAVLEPDMKMTIAGSAYFPQDCHLSPERFIDVLTNKLRAMGAQFEFGAEVSAFRASAGKIDGVETTRGSFSADEYVLAGGSWSASIARDLGLKLPMQAGKGYSLTLPNPPRLPQICSILVEARVAVTPMGSSLRFAGTMEIAGLDTSINPARVRGIVNSIPAYYPEISTSDFESIKAWSGLRPCSPDGLPYIGRFARYANLSAATGHSMMGLSLGPITGKLMAEILSNEKPSIDLTLLRPERYS